MSELTNKGVDAAVLRPPREAAAQAALPGALVALAVYEVEIDAAEEVFVATLPAGAQYLGLAEVPAMAGWRMWWLGDPQAGTQERAFKHAATGDATVVPTDVYLGTYQVDGGVFVRHLFDVGPVGAYAKEVADDV